MILFYTKYLNVRIMVESSTASNLDTAINTNVEDQVITFDDVFSNKELLKKVLNNLFSSAINKIQEQMEGKGTDTWCNNEDGENAKIFA